MMASWVIAAQYFQRIARKPFLIVFLAAIPFTLLLAEFAAFGRVGTGRPLMPVPVWLVRGGVASHAAERFTACLAEQPGQPLQVQEVAGALTLPNGIVRATLSATSPLEVSLETAPGIGTAESILAASIVKICATRVAQPSFSPPPVSVARAEQSPNPAALKSSAFFARFFPGLALFGTLFLSQSLASLVWRDQERTVLRRLLSMPVRASALVFGPFLFLTTGSALVLLLLLAVCALATNPAALLSLVFWEITLGFALCAAGLQLATGLMARSQRAAQAMSASTNMLLAFFGGGFVPLSVYPPFLRTIAYALPNGAAQAGITQLLEGAGNAAGLFWRVSTIWIWAAILVCAAIVLQHRRISG